MGSGKDTIPRERPLDTAFLDRYNYLDKTGALDDLANLRKENRELDSLVNDAATIFSIGTVTGMIDFLISRLLDRFVPTNLAFMFEPPRGGGVLQYHYENLKPSKEILPQSYYFTLKSFFRESPFPIEYEFLKAKLGAESFGSDFEKYDPELLFPMCGIEGLYGIVLLGSKFVGGQYTDLERMYLDKVTRFLSIGIQNSLHHESSITDSKTGLYNHFHFMNRLDQEIARTVRHRTRAGLIMLDVDHFKSFNDTSGHIAGDLILNSLALVIKNSIRSEDVAARFGGDEFCILAVECGKAHLMEVAERIRKTIADSQVLYKTGFLSVTVSLGCCILDQSHVRNASEYIDMADRALYLSKSSGRNRTSLFSPGLLDKAPNPP